MKLKELKKLINRLSPEELEQELQYNSVTLSLSGSVIAVRKAKENLYYTGEDDPSKLYTRKELVEQGLDREEISQCLIEIGKGRIVVEF